MKLDVIIATFNRSVLLRRTLESLFAAERPTDLEIAVTIVDTSSDDTAEVVKEFQSRGEIEVVYIFEPRRGKSRALNTGIAQSDADLIGLTDDDVEVAGNWFVEISRLFQTRWSEIDYAGGKVLPRWEASPPAWLPKDIPGVLSLHDYGDEEILYDESFSGQLTGAHGIIKLEALREVGPYNESLGPVGGSLLGSEDDEMYARLVGAGKRGIYCQNLVVYHRVPAYRLTKKYYRHWCHGWGRAQAMIDKMSGSYHGPRILGVPRYRYREALNKIGNFVEATVRGDSAGRFSSELFFWIQMGFFVASNSDRFALRKLTGALLPKQEAMTR
jgi:glucosyl-dolichyl phosphate glucuronosyltransferase